MRIPTHDGRRRRIVGFLLSVCTVTVLAACASGSASAPMAATGGSTGGAAAAASAEPAPRDAATAAATPDSPEADMPTTLPAISRDDGAHAGAPLEPCALQRYRVDAPHTRSSVRLTSRSRA